MRGLKKSKKVSWPADENLSQVRLLPSDDCHSQPQLLPNPGGAHVDGKPTPGFIDPPFASIKSARTPTRCWKCPPRLVLCSDWLIVAGEESQEVGNQCRRVSRIPEAVYHRLSSIPPNPCTAIDAEVGRCEDQQALQIPVIPIEEDGQPSDLLPRPVAAVDLIDEAMVLEPDELAVAYAAAEIVKSSQQGRAFEHRLLLKILSNPKLVERLVDSTTRFPRADPPGAMGRPEQRMENQPRKQPGRGPGGEPESNKCAFFHSPVGCRYGEKCPHQHDMFRPRFPGIQVVSTAKRVKVDGGEQV